MVKATKVPNVKKSGSGTGTGTGTGKKYEGTTKVIPPAKSE